MIKMQPHLSTQPYFVYTIYYICVTLVDLGFVLEFQVSFVISISQRAAIAL